MRREIRTFQLKCDGCGACVNLTTFATFLDKRPKGWTDEKDPTEHWIGAAADYCPRCSDQRAVQKVAKSRK